MERQGDDPNTQERNAGRDRSRPHWLLRSYDHDCRSAYRYYTNPYLGTINYFGFRIVSPGP